MKTEARQNLRWVQLCFHNNLIYYWLQVKIHTYLLAIQRPIWLIYKEKISIEHTSKIKKHLTLGRIRSIKHTPALQFHRQVNPQDTVSLPYLVEVKGLTVLCLFLI